jgi:hypothetical protein
MANFTRFNLNLTTRIPILQSDEQGRCHES